MKADERSRTKRNKGSVRDDMGAIVGGCIMYEYAMLCDQVDRTDRDVARGFSVIDSACCSANSSSRRCNEPNNSL
jgi:hypothetical protein